MAGSSRYDEPTFSYRKALSRKFRGNFAAIMMKGDRGRTGRQPQLRTRFASVLAGPALASAISLLSTGAGAVTLGGYEVQSALGQSLRMSIQINARPDEEIDASCFRVNPFSTSGDGLPQLTTAQLRLDRRPNDIRLVITSSRAIMDPIVRAPPHCVPHSTTHRPPHTWLTIL